MSDEEVKNMTAEAEKHAEEDKLKKERIDARNQADTLIFTSEKTLKDAGDKVKAEAKADVESKIKALKEILESGSKDELEAKTKDLSEAIQKVGAAMYSSPEASAKGDESKKAEKGKVQEGEVVNE